MLVIAVKSKFNSGKLNFSFSFWLRKGGPRIPFLFYSAFNLYLF